MKTDGRNFVDNMYSASVIINGQLLPQERQGMRDDAVAVGPALPGVPPVLVTDMYGRKYITTTQPGYSGRFPSPPGWDNTTVDRREAMTLPYRSPGFDPSGLPRSSQANPWVKPPSKPAVPTWLVLGVVVVAIVGIAMKMAERE